MQKITVTKSLIFINVVVMLFLLWQSQTFNTPDIKVLEQFGGVHVGAEGWKTVAYMFLHGSIFHIIMNMLALMDYGKKLEQRIGALVFTLFYLVAGIISGACILYFGSPEALAVGASGAICGLIGADLIFSWKVRKTSDETKRDFNINRFNVIFIILIGFIPGISAIAHLGGLVFGALFGMVYYKLKNKIAKPLLTMDDRLIG